MRTPNYKRFLTISIALYVVALFTPIFDGSDDTGISALVFGIFGDDHYHILAWSANIFYFINLIIGRKRLWFGLALSVGTLTLGLFATGIDEVLVHEGGLKQSVTLGTGFYLWVLSFLTLLTGQLLNWKNRNDV
mgnify:CR=1 FL=1|tara:strand:+ start:285 stop:686 length:402 start_codon:yes stop_codon:yes gene_type:complete